ncbi:MAG: hypothetical protein AABZ31_14060 [Bdellovibrionota bacterium]
MKILFYSALLMLFIFNFNLPRFAFAGFPIEVKGRVLKVDKGDVVLLSNGQEQRIPMKKLSKADQKKINAAVSQKKEVTLKVPPQVLEL